MKDYGVFGRIKMSWFTLLLIAAGLSACATFGEKSGQDAMNYAAPLIAGKSCADGKAFYQTLRNAHPSKSIVANVQTDVSPDPNNWYPTKREYQLNPEQTRILGCPVVSVGDGKPDHQIIYSLQSARFK